MTAALQALIAKWRKQAADCRRYEQWLEFDVLSQCADELEAALIIANPCVPLPVILKRNYDPPAFEQLEEKEGS